MSICRIMIVDDEDELLDILSRIIGTKYEVVVAHNGLDALEKLDRYEPDFIILDVMMPLMDGFETCKALRKNPAYETTPIYFLTSSTSREDVKKGYSFGGNLYLQKPFDPFRLLKNIDYYIEKNALSPRKKKFTLKQIKDMEKAQPVPQAVVEPSPKAPVRVIVIDDNEETLEYMGLALRKFQDKKWSFEAILTTEPVDALTQIVHYQPDIILLDIRMPKLDGFQLCKIIKINQNLKDTEIQFISGIATPKDMDFAAHLTGNALLRKPFEVKDLLAVLINICEKPGFRIKEKRMSYDEIKREMQMEKQNKEEKFRIEQEKKAREKHMQPLKDLYKEIKSEEKKERKKQA